MEKTEQFPNPFNLFYVSILVKNPKKLFVKGRYNLEEGFHKPATNQIFYFQLNQVATAQGFLLVQLVTLAVHHHTTVFILLKRARSKAKTCCPLRKVFSAVLLTLFLM